MELFLNKEKILWEWCLEQKEFNKVSVNIYGINNYYLRAVRTVQEWAESGRIERIPDDEKIRRGLIKSGQKNIAWWRIKSDQ